MIISLDGFLSFVGPLIILLIFALPSIQVDGSVEMTKNQTAYFCCFDGCWMMVHVGWIIEMTKTLKRIYFSQDVDVGC